MVCLHLISLSSLATTKGKKEKKNGVQDFTVFSSILDTFFFNEMRERDYPASGCEASVPDQMPSELQRKCDEITGWSPRFGPPGPEASSRGHLLYLWAQPPEPGSQVTTVSSSPASQPQVPPLIVSWLSPPSMFVSDEVSWGTKAAAETEGHPRQPFPTPSPYLL